MSWKEIEKLLQFVIVGGDAASIAFAKQLESMG
jgi:hypothetical protein